MTHVSAASTPVWRNDTALQYFSMGLLLRLVRIGNHDTQKIVAGVGFKDAQGPATLEADIQLIMEQPAYMRFLSYCRDLYGEKPLMETADKISQMLYDNVKDDRNYQSKQFRATLANMPAQQILELSKQAAQIAVEAKLVPAPSPEDSLFNKTSFNFFSQAQAVAQSRLGNNVIQFPSGKR